MGPLSQALLVFTIDVFLCGIGHGRLRQDDEVQSGQPHPLVSPMGLPQQALDAVPLDGPADSAADGQSHAVASLGVLQRDQCEETALQAYTSS